MMDVASSFKNVGKLLPDYTALQPRRQLSSYCLPSEPQISFNEKICRTPDFLRILRKNIRMRDSNFFRAAMFHVSYKAKIFCLKVSESLWFEI
jgi:hypothetical protein